MLLRRLSVLLAVLALLAAACGETNGIDETPPEASVPGAEVDDDFTDTDTDLPEAGDDTSGAPVSEESRGVTVEGDLDSKPEISLPGGEPPAELVIVDIEEGDGAEASAGDTVTTHYVGVSWLNDGAEFDASWNRRAPISFPLSGVIQGWGEGIPGMKVGGRRLLIIPPSLGYGAQAPTPAIAPNDTLVFVIDLTEVN